MTPLSARCAGIDDVALASLAIDLGIAPLPLSVWSSEPQDATPGFLLGVTNLREGNLEKACAALRRLLADVGPLERTP